MVFVNSMSDLFQDDIADEYNLARGGSDGAGELAHLSSGYRVIGDDDESVAGKVNPSPWKIEPGLRSSRSWRRRIRPTTSRGAPRRDLTRLASQI